MWMMEINNHVRDSNMYTDPAFGRKLRPLAPRPICSGTTTTPYSTLMPTPCSCYCIHQNPNIPSWNQTLICGVSSDYGNKKMINMTNMPLVSTRWNPTPEQLEALEELYRRGTRTPSSQQIQQITAKLRRYGKIEGKNVFYWFQNHKARERQKKRRQLELLATAGKKMGLGNSGLKLMNKRNFEIEHPKKLPTTTNCSNSILGEGAECNKDGWTGLNESNNSWKLDLSSCNTVVQQAAITEQSSRNEGGNSSSSILFSSEIEGNQTLELFPIKKRSGLDQEIKFRPNNEFIEFLPLKI